MIVILLFLIIRLQAQVLECGTDFTDQQLDSLEMDMDDGPVYADKTYRFLLKHHVYVNNNNIQATKHRFDSIFHCLLIKPTKCSTAEILNSLIAQKYNTYMATGIF